MASITEIKTGLKSRFATIDGLRAYATASFNPQPPGIYILGPVSWRYDQTMDGVAIYTFEARLYVNAADGTRAQTAIDAYLAPNGSSSLRAALDADTTLGGVAHFARLIGGNEYARLVEDGGSKLLSAVVEIEVMAS